MKYQNIIFDYGNVLGSFDPKYILEQFCDSKEDCSILYDVVYRDWLSLDDGSADYRTYILDALLRLPERLHPHAKAFFRAWYLHCPGIKETWDLAMHFKEEGRNLYLLSNASVYFAEHAMEVCPILEIFDGILFSGPNQCAKPGEQIYQLLFHQFHLKPEDCFFIDDSPANIDGAKKCGMNGMVFDGNKEKASVIVERLAMEEKDGSKF